MNLLAQTLTALCDAAGERIAETGHGRWAQRFHLMPAAGWLNDPNGLHQRDGIYHAFYQASPLAVDGGLKCWGHATSRDLLRWHDAGTALVPETHWDCHGVYSGSALVDGDATHLFYTGNVKHVDAGETYDYVTTGRESNQMVVTLGRPELSLPKRPVLTQADYPADETAHVRDPKVFPSAGLAAAEGAPRNLMLLGARRAGEDRASDKGEALVYGSDGVEQWRLLNHITTPERFGYVWECPDYVELDEKRLLLASPQGLTGPEWEGRNVYQSGWFEFSGTLTGDYELGPFHLWDHGFDFYAPQTFVDEQGRRVLVGWMGMADCPGHLCRERESGWQHCFTVPREVTTDGRGQVLCRPVGEVASARGAAIRVQVGATTRLPRCFDLELSCSAPLFHAVVGDGLELTWSERTGQLEMRFSDPSQAGIGAGRGSRTCPVARLDTLRVLGDVSSVEVFVNGGEAAMSTRHYPDRYSVALDTPVRARCWELAV